MFSSEDVRELFQSFPPSAVPSPALILTSSGQGLITREQLRVDYETHLMKAKQRVPVADLALELDVDLADLLRLVRSGNPPAILSADGNDIIPKQEIDAIAEKLRSSLSAGVISKREQESRTNIAFDSLQPILGQIADELIHYDDHVCTHAYDKVVSAQALDIIDRVINENNNVDISKKDLEALPGSPPKWLFLRHLEHYARPTDFEGKVAIREMPDCIRVQSKNMRVGKVKEWSEPLLFGQIPYVDLQSAMAGNVTHENIEDVVNDFEGLPRVEVKDNFAISETWLSNFIDQKLQALQSEEEGVLDVSQHLNKEVQSTQEGHNKLPERLYSHLERKAEQYLINALSQRTDHDYHRFGTVILTNEQYKIEQSNLATQAQEEALSQWQKLEDNPDHDLKFTIANISTSTPNKSSIHEALLKDKPTQKACDEHFWTSIATLETSNESSFATFWSDRVDSKLATYAAGLTSITDPKLHDQLSDLLATYIHKDLVPDSIAKARPQGLVMSRRTKKNLAKLESSLSTTKTEVSVLVSTLEKFNKKQAIRPSNDAKKAMLNDMLRRMGKPSSSDPILFLYLVVILHAKHYEGIVYATGKYAPKLMKMLKGKVSDEDMGRLEGWKEGAKTGSLGEEGRVGMRGMAEVAIGCRSLEVEGGDEGGGRGGGEKGDLS